MNETDAEQFKPVIKQMDIAWENGSLVPIEGEQQQTSETSNAAEAIARLMRWVWGEDRPSKRNGEHINGIAGRALMACWLSLPELRDKTLTDISRTLGKHKQSAGRHLAAFDKAFPGMRRAGKKWRKSASRANLGRDAGNVSPRRGQSGSL